MNHYSVELRLQDPLDSARRPSVPTSEDGVGGEDEDTEADGHDGRNTSNGSLAGDLDSLPVSQINECERLRRQRIGLANKGKTPWNKGKHHSPATIALLRERNKIVMQDPKIREKLRQYSRPQSQETREKLRIFMKARMQFERRQLTIVQEWKDFIADIAREGFLGEEELQWDSYLTVKAELRRQYFSSNKKRRKSEKVPRSFTMEQRLKISESVRRKWADPEYRTRVLGSLQYARQRLQGKRKSKVQLLDTEFDDLLNILGSSPAVSSHNQVAKVGSYNDPLSEEKLEKIKLLRVRSASQKEAEMDREAAGSSTGTTLEHNGGLSHSQKGNEYARGMAGAATDDGSSPLESVKMAEVAVLQRAQREAAEKARILLAEAERAATLAAHALDAAGAHDESLRDSLLEAWMLLDEANQSILTMGVGSQQLTN